MFFLTSKRKKGASQLQTYCERIMYTGKDPTLALQRQQPLLTEGLRYGTVKKFPQAIKKKSTSSVGFHPILDVNYRQHENAILPVTLHEKRQILS